MSQLALLQMNQICPPVWAPAFPPADTPPAKAPRPVGGPTAGGLFRSSRRPRKTGSSASAAWPSN